YHKWCKDMALYILNEQAHTEPFLAKLYQLSDVYVRFLSESTQEGMDLSFQVLKATFNFNPRKTKYIIDERYQMQIED
ncbi:MAG: hypothetical protein QXO71_08665, partial [Candidatus Jordarchaeaceae archaeon]